MSRTLVLDLDGTLVDSLPDLMTALNRLLAGHGLAPMAPAEVAALVGDGGGVLVRRAFAARGAVADEEDVAGFLADYTAHVADGTIPFPGVIGTLLRLHAAGWRLAVCTNKPELAARDLLAGLELEGHFVALTGGDTFPVRKPHPEHVLRTIERAGGDPARAVMVGDHANDVLAAIGAGVPCIFAAWGYGNPAMAAGAVAIATAFDQLPELAAAILS